MAIEAIDKSFMRQLDPEDRLNLSACLQCGRCSSGCTMRTETDILPHQLNRMILYGMRDELLRSKAIWLCVSCHTCFSRCPMEVDTPAMIDALRMIAREAPEEMSRVRIFNDLLLGSVRRFGRVYELGLMAAYKLKAKDFFGDLGKLPAMLRKGKLRLLPSAAKGRSAVSAIFDRVRARRAER
jgi:heterodisulfide reductase subunit C